MFSSCHHRRNVYVSGEEWLLTSPEEFPAAWQTVQQQQQPCTMLETQATTSAMYQHHPLSHCEMQMNDDFESLHNHHYDDRYQHQHHQQQQQLSCRFYNNVPTQSSAATINITTCPQNHNDNFYQHIGPITTPV